MAVDPHQTLRPGKHPGASSYAGKRIAGWSEFLVFRASNYGDTVGVGSSGRISVGSGVGVLVAVGSGVAVRVGSGVEVGQGVAVGGISQVSVVWH